MKPILKILSSNKLKTRNRRRTRKAKIMEMNFKTQKQNFALRHYLNMTNITKMNCFLLAKQL